MTMYIPSTNAEVRIGVLQDFIRAYPFATLVTSSDDGLFVSYLPVVLDGTRGPYGVLEGHIARANPHHRLTGLADALFMFQGPNAYVSPTWYQSKAEHGRVVPTWNYVAVHARGTLRFRDDEPFLRRHLDQLTTQQEAAHAHPWAVADAPADYVSSLQRAIVGVEFEITQLEGKWKMSQNRSAADIDGVVAGLGTSADPMDRAVSRIVAHVRSARREPGG